MTSIKPNLIIKLRQRIQSGKIQLAQPNELLHGFTELNPYQYLSGYLLNQILAHRKISLSNQIKRSELINFIVARDQSDSIWIKSVWNHPEKHWTRLAVLAGLARINLCVFQAGFLNGSDPGTILVNYLSGLLGLIATEAFDTVSLRIMLYKRSQIEPMTLNSLNRAELLRYYRDPTLPIHSEQDERIKQLQELTPGTLALLSQLHHCPKEQLSLYRTNLYERGLIGLETERAEVIAEQCGVIVPPLLMPRSYLIHNLPSYQIMPDPEPTDFELIRRYGVIPCYDSHTSMINRYVSLSSEPGWFRLAPPLAEDNPESKLSSPRGKSNPRFGYGTLEHYQVYRLSELAHELTNLPPKQIRRLSPPFNSTSSTSSSSSSSSSNAKSESPPTTELEVLSLIERDSDTPINGLRQALKQIYELYFVAYPDINLSDYAQRLYPIRLPLVNDDNRDQIRKFLEKLYKLGALVRGMKPGGRYPSLVSPYELNLSDPDVLHETKEKVRKELRKHEALNKLTVYVNEETPCEYTLITLFQLINSLNPPVPQLYIGLSLMFTAKVTYEAIFRIKLPGS